MFKFSFLKDHTCQVKTALEGGKLSIETLQ